METQNDYQSYTIKTAGFEGPFGLLLGLIEKRKLHINDVSLAEVTEDYLKHLNTLNELSPAEISSFVLVASTLLLIKSKSLLPNLDLTSEEEGDIKNLEERLRLYEMFTRLGGNIKNNFGKRIIFSAEERKPARRGGNNVLVFLPDEQITKDSMMTFARNVIGAMPKKVFLPEVEVRKVISIEEMIDNLTERIKNSLKISFKDMHGKVATKEEKITMIVGFLAMLELVREGIMEATQNENFEDIIMEQLEPRNYEPGN